MDYKNIWLRQSSFKNNRKKCRQICSNRLLQLILAHLKNQY